MIRRLTAEAGDSSVSSDESHGKGEFISRASKLITGLGRGVNLLNAHESPTRNGLEERFLEAKNNNLFDGRGSNLFSVDNSGIDEESLSSASTFDIPKLNEDGGGSCADTGGLQVNDSEADIDRLQTEITAPCTIQTQDDTLERNLSGMTMDSLASKDTSKKKQGLTEERRHNSMHFFKKIGSIGGNRRDVNKMTGSLTSIKNDNTDTTGTRKNLSWKPGGLLTGSFRQSLEKDEEEDTNTAAREQDKLRASAKLMRKHLHTANNQQSFRDLKRVMVEKGAVTGSSVRAILQQQQQSDLPSDDDSIEDMGLSAEHNNDSFFRASNTIPAMNVIDESLAESNSTADFKRLERLKNDPLFGDKQQRPYIHLPSRVPIFQSLSNAILRCTDEGRTSLLTIHGGKYLGKSKLINAVINNIQGQSHNSYTVLRSERSVNTEMVSFFPFHKIISSALRECEKRTRTVGIHSYDENEEEESIIHRLIDRKVLDTKDQCILSRMLPFVTVGNHDLSSLLGGKSHTAITKDTAATINKLFIPLQPVLLIFDAADDGELDASSVDLLEELALSSPASCPQLITILLSRQPTNLSTALLDMQVDTSIETITKSDSEVYIRSFFDPNCTNNNMTVDGRVLDIIHARANGCPLFLERLLLWAQRKGIIEVDASRNVVTISSQSELNDVLPMSLYEEVLGEINSLSYSELDSLKLACCMGMIFSPETYEALNSDGLFDTLNYLTSTHSLFCNKDGHYMWRYSVVFDAVSSILITDERQEIHERIADSFSQSASTTCDVRRAKHYSIAHRLNEAWDLYMDAGKQKEKLFDFKNALTCYNQAKLNRRKRSSLVEKLSCSTSLGWCLQALERYDDAEQELETALEWTMSLSDNDRHAEYSLLTALAKVKSHQSKYREAIDLYEKALPLIDSGSHSPKWLANHVSSFGEILRKSGELIKARELHQQALEYRKKAVDNNSGTSLELAISHTQLGCTYYGLQDFVTSSQYHKKALTARVSELDFNSAPVSESLNYCADSLQATGYGKQALPLSLHAVEIRKKLFGLSHPAYAHALSVLASTYFSIGRPLESLDLMKECIDICDKAFPSNHSNLIPNLMLYGKVLRVSGDVVNSLSVYRRALFIHMVNFSSNQNEGQLKELNDCIRQLESNASTLLQVSPDMPLPTIESDLNKINIILCTSLSHCSDEYAFSVAASLQQMGSINLIAIVVSEQSESERAKLARRTLDSLLLCEVPVGSKRNESKTSPYICNGAEIIARALNQAPDAKSLTLLCDSCPVDIVEVMVKHPALFTEKVNEVIIIGSVQPPRRRSNIEPSTTYNADHDQAMARLYSGCQQFNIPTITMSNHLSKGFPFPSNFVDELTRTNHIISLDVQQKEIARARHLWEEGGKETRKLIFGNEKPKADELQHNVWPLVKSIDIELVLGLLCCIPMYRDAHFRWDKHIVNGTEHKICKAKVVKSEALSEEILMMVGFALRAGLMNTSC